MVVLGGSTRLTGSGLSITQWKPISGALPPLSLADWQAEFARYRAIPQFRFVNPAMTLDQFRFIYWWEWSHRFLARLLGVVFLVPLRLVRRAPARCRAGWSGAARLHRSCWAACRAWSAGGWWRAGWRSGSRSRRSG